MASNAILEVLPEVLTENPSIAVILFADKVLAQRRGVFFICTQLEIPVKLQLPLAVSSIQELRHFT